MKTIAVSPDKIKFRPVYLSDLKPIREVYWGNESPDKAVAGAHFSCREIGMDFGIPLNLAEQNGKIIAYSFLNLSPGREVRLQVLVAPDYREPDVKKDLKAYSSSGLTNAYIDGNPQQVWNTAGIEYAIDKLVTWLNKCPS